MTVEQLRRYIYSLNGIMDADQIIDMVQLLGETQDVEFTLEKVLYLLQ